MKALVFAAGLGTRLRPITDHMPKALVPVSGVPMLERVILKLASQGCDSFVVNVHHFAGQIKAFLADKSNWGLPIAISEELEEPLETGGGIRHAAPLLKSAQGRFLVHNADILSTLDVGWFIGQDDPGTLATLLVRDAPADRCLLFDDDMRLVGWTNLKTGEVKSPFLPDFDPAKYRKLSFCGIHIISEDVFPAMAPWPEKFSIIDFYLAMAAGHTIKGVLAPADMRLVDIGSLEGLREAEAVAARF